MTDRNRAYYHQGGQLMDRTRTGRIVSRGTFVSSSRGSSDSQDDDCISLELVAKVSQKACEFQITFKDEFTGAMSYYHGQGGLLRGEQQQQRQPSSHSNVRRSHPATPVTAKHNLRVDTDRNGSDEEEESYLRSTVHCHDGVKAEIVLPEGGCQMKDQVTIRSATRSSREVHWNAADISFGQTITDPRHECFDPGIPTV